MLPLQLIIIYMYSCAVLSAPTAARYKVISLGKTWENRSVNKKVNKTPKYLRHTSLQDKGQKGSWNRVENEADPKTYKMGKYLQLETSFGCSIKELITAEDNHTTTQRITTF